jgi:amidophosphoribosyltransferase
MCGVVGMVAKTPVNQALYDALQVLQHRGQDAAGIMTCEYARLHLRKGAGLARDVFRAEHMRQLCGNIGIGHVRYPTAGSASSTEAQPFYVNSPYGIGLAHNGNLTNAQPVRQALFAEDRRHINTGSDSEILLNVFAHELSTQTDKLTVNAEDIFRAVQAVHRRCRGGYAVIALIAGYGMVAFRDPNGIRPLVYGVRDGEAGREWMVASESVALSVSGFTLVRDIAPGEALIVTASGEHFFRQCAQHTQHSPCLFEYVYFARPDSVMDGVFVHKARQRMGVSLADKVRRVLSDQTIDVVIPIPDTSRTCAMTLAETLQVPYAEGFIKNRYIGRTFIMPGQTRRKKSVRQKLNPIDIEFHNKRVLLVDDSIVRGTTSQEIITMARESGARQVYFASAAPAVRHPNVYGIDMPAMDELIAYGRTEREVGALIGADAIIYQDLNDLIAAVQKKGKDCVDRFDTSVFNGDYVTGDVTPSYLSQLQAERNDTAQAGQADGNHLTDLL